MDDAARVVAVGYDTVADAYAALEQQGGEWPRSRHLANLVRRLPDDATVLDLGCGNGVPVASELAAAGVAVTGVDVSEEQVRRDRGGRREPGRAGHRGSVSVASRPAADRFKIISHADHLTN